MHTTARISHAILIATLAVAVAFAGEATTTARIAW